MNKLYMGMSLIAVVFFQACGGSGDEENPAESNSPTFYAMPARYSPENYPEFVSQKSTSDLEGTWIAFLEGVKEYGETPVVTGGNYKISYQYYARYVVRLRKKLDGSEEYFVYTCGPGGARDATTYISGPDIYIPFLVYSSGSYTSYGMTIRDAITIENTSITRDWDWIGSQGWAMSYDFSIIAKKISDDPFYSVSHFNDNQTSVSTNIGCVYEAEGSYLETQDDNSVHDYRKAGTFAEVKSFPMSPLTSDLSSYGSNYNIAIWDSNRITYNRENEQYRTIDGDTINVTTTVNGYASSYTIQAFSASNPEMNDETSIFID